MPAALKVFLLTLAVVDDLGSIAVMVLFCSRGVDPWALALAAGLLTLAAVLVRAGITAATRLAVRLGLLLASFVAGVAGSLVLLRTGRPSPPTAARTRPGGPGPGGG